MKTSRSARPPAFLSPARKNRSGNLRLRRASCPLHAAIKPRAPRVLPLADLDARYFDDSAPARLSVLPVACARRSLLSSCQLDHHVEKTLVGHTSIQLSTYVTLPRFQPAAWSSCLLRVCHRRGGARDALFDARDALLICSGFSYGARPAHERHKLCPRRRVLRSFSCLTTGCSRAISAAHAQSLFAMADSNGTRAVRVAEAALGPVPAHLLIRTPALTHVHVAHRPCMKYSDTCTARTHVWTARLEPGLEGPSAPWRA